MTGAEWQEVCEWIADRFPESQWHAEQAVAYFFDVEKFDASDVWGAVLALYEKGLRFPPTGSQLVAGSYEQRREAAMRDRYRGLPDTPVEQIGWEEYTVRHFGQPMTADAVIRRLHAERFPDCSSPTCDIHRKEQDADERAGGG